MYRALAAAALSAAFLVPASAPAAEPASGKVSGGKQVTWNGSASGYGITLLGSAAEVRPYPCEAPICDRFELEVAEAGKLTIQVTDGAGFIELQVTQPDGTVLYTPGEDAQPSTIVIDNAKPGAYTVDTSTNAPVGLGGEYQGRAFIGADPAEMTEAPAAPPAPAPAAAEPAKVTVATKSAKAGKSVKIAFSTSGPLTDVRAVLRKGSKVVARASAKSAKGRFSLVLKSSRKLAKGGYTVSLQAKDGTRPVTASGKLKLR